ncbi:related to p33ing1b protein [Ceraceosorus bombacis]|uniref:Chromatin modification-related protein n=1 Tax=Ceraceosorus bombacis TaxID=401625 RepID=A0A0N7LAV3_9BASI|nr:related to p33ing1b protein [Ceraceosorus bombacis]
MSQSSSLVTIPVMSAGPFPSQAARAGLAGPSSSTPATASAPVDAQDSSLFANLAAYADALDALPLDLTRSFSDLRELDAVLGSHLAGLTARLSHLSDAISQQDMSQGERLLALKECAEEARAYKMGGEDKIRVAVNTAETIISHTSHISTLLTALSSHPGLAPYLDSPPSHLAGHLSDGTPIVGGERPVIQSGAGGTAKDGSKGKKGGPPRLARLGGSAGPSGPLAAVSSAAAAAGIMGASLAGTVAGPSASPSTGKGTNPTPKKRKANPNGVDEAPSAGHTKSAATSSSAAKKKANAAAAAAATAGAISAGAGGVLAGSLHGSIGSGTAGAQGGSTSRPRGGAVGANAPNGKTAADRQLTTSNERGERTSRDGNGEGEIDGDDAKGQSTSRSRRPGPSGTAHAAASSAAASKHNTSSASPAPSTAGHGAGNNGGAMPGQIGTGQSSNASSVAPPARSARVTRAVRGGADENPSNATAVAEEDERRYCYCDNISYGDMIGCDGDDCEREWFHLACVGMTKPPHGSWLCDECRHKTEHSKKHGGGNGNSKYTKGGGKGHSRR